MPADIAQQRDVAQFVEPVGVVDHHRVGRAVAEGQELGEDLADAGHVAGDLGVAEQRARLVLARGVADPRRAAAHQHDRLVPGLLEQAQQHDPQQAADMQAVGGAVVADIGGDGWPSREARVERRQIGALMDIAALGGGGEKGGFGGSDMARSSSTNPVRALGLMSGTSLDGIDVAALETDGETASCGRARR